MDGKSLICLSAMIAISIAPAFSQRLSLKKLAPAAILAVDSAHNLSGYKIAANAGVSWLPYKNSTSKRPALAIISSPAHFLRRSNSRLASGRRSLVK